MDQLGALADGWANKAREADYLSRQYTQCADYYKNADKIFRSTIAICSLVSAYMISLQAGSSNTETGSIVFYIELGFGFSAAAVSTIALNINFPGLIGKNIENASQFQQAKLHCWQERGNVKWLKDNLYGVGDEAVDRLILMKLKAAKHNYTGRWEALPHHNKCCLCPPCDIGVTTQGEENA